VSRPSHAKTYAEALEELGGRPWRTLDGTEQWFLVDDEPEEREQELDTAAFRIPRPSNRWWVAAGAAAVAGGIFAVLVGSAVATPAPPPPAPPAQIYVVAPPPPPPAPMVVAQVTPPASVATQNSKPAPIKKRIKHRRKSVR
jgi:hypothetical protein